MSKLNDEQWEHGRIVGALDAREGHPLVLMLHWSDSYADGYSHGWQEEWEKKRDKTYKNMLDKLTEPYPE